VNPPPANVGTTSRESLDVKGLSIKTDVPQTNSSWSSNSSQSRLTRSHSAPRVRSAMASQNLENSQPPSSASATSPTSTGEASKAALLRTRSQSAVKQPGGEAELPGQRQGVSHSPKVAASAAAAAAAAAVAAAAAGFASAAGTGTCTVAPALERRQQGTSSRLRQEPGPATPGLTLRRLTMPGGGTNTGATQDRLDQCAATLLHVIREQ